MKYIFTLGQSTDLAKQELINFLPSPPEIVGDNFIVASSEASPVDLQNQLGGTIKIAKYLDQINNLDKLTVANWQKYLDLPTSDKKLYFGFSLYNDSNKAHAKLNKIALGLKKELKGARPVRLVSGKEKILSSVIVSKNHLVGTELLIIKHENNWLLGLTQAVQDFEKYGHRDMDRPGRDDKSGMLPPKVAQMMINLAGADRNKTLLDPFCGSGTILQEAMLMGYKKIYGTDNSSKAIDDSQQNTEWLKQNFELSSDVEIKKIDAQKLGNHFDPGSIDLIISEPFMGDASFVYRQKNVSDLKDVSVKLQELYKNTFTEFKKILSQDGKIIFIFPVFQIVREQLPTLEKEIIEKIGFNLQKPTLTYQRPGQKVLRQITIWKKD